MVKEEIRFKGIIDVGIIALSHCKNPAQKSNLIFLLKVLILKILKLVKKSRFESNDSTLNKKLVILAQNEKEVKKKMIIKEIF